MCDLVTAITVGSAVMGYATQAKQAKAETAALQTAAVADAAQTAIQQGQINDRATQDMSDRAREAMIERGRLRTAAADSGLGGLSDDRLESASYFAEGTDIARIEGNRGRAMEQAGAAATGRQAAISSRMAAVKQPSLIGAGLQIAGAGVDYTTKNPGWYKSKPSSSPSVGSAAWANNYSQNYG